MRQRNLIENSWCEAFLSTRFRRVGAAFVNGEGAKAALSIKLDFPVGATELVLFDPRKREGNDDDVVDSCPNNRGSSLLPRTSRESQRGLWIGCIQNRMEKRKWLRLKSKYSPRQGARPSTRSRSICIRSVDLALWL